MKWMRFLTGNFCFLFFATGVFANNLPMKDTIPINNSATFVKQNNFFSLDSTLGKAFEKTVSPPSISFYSLFNPHKIFYRVTSISSLTDLNILEQNISYKTQADITTQYAVNDTLNNECTFNVSITKLKAQMETMGIQLRYNSQDSTQDTTSAFAKPLLGIADKNIRLSVDTNGVIKAIDTSSMGEKVMAALSRLSISGNDFQVNNNFGLMLSHNNDSLSLGESWSDSIAFPNGSKRIITYTVQSLLNNEIVLIITGSIIQKGDIQSDGHKFTTDFSGTQLGKIVAAKNTRLVKSRSVTYTLKGSVQVEGKDYPASAVSKINEIITSE